MKHNQLTYAVLAAVMLLGVPDLNATNLRADTKSELMPDRPVGDLIRPYICGLVSMNDMRFMFTNVPATNNLEEPRAHPGVFKATVILARWKDLEPARGVYDFSTIEQALENIRSYNVANPHAQMTAKLRVMPGPNAPDWAKALDGDPIVIDTVIKHGPSIPTTIEQQTVGHFWGGNYRVAWKELQNALAQQYDDQPLIQEVAVTSCGPRDGEPYLLGTPDTDTLNNLYGAGFSDQVWQSCLSTATEDYADWKNTALDFAFSPFNSTTSGHEISITDMTTPTMTSFRQTMGPRGVIGYHGLSTDVPSSEYNQQQMAAFYEVLQEERPPLEFQLKSPIGDIDQVLQYGFTFHPTEIELWDSQAAGQIAVYSQADLAKWASEFACENRKAVSSPPKTVP